MHYIIIMIIIIITSDTSKSIIIILHFISFQFMNLKIIWSKGLAFCFS